MYSEVLETRYYMQLGHYWKIDIAREYDYESPREIWDHAANMAAWCGWRGREQLGDNIGHSNMEDALRHLVRGNVKDKQIISFIRRGKTRMSVDYNRHERRWYLYSKHDFNDCFGHKAGDHCTITWTDQGLDWLIDDIIDEMTPAECAALLEEYADMVLLPLCGADYGCNDYRIGKAHSFDDCNGLAWIEKDNVISWTATDKEWKDAGYQIIKGELEEYNMYLSGDVYVGFWHRYDVETGRWVEDDIVGGFYSNKYGDALVREIAETSGKLYSDFNLLLHGVA